MNGLKEIQACLKNFISEKGNIKKQIVEIENKRTQLAQKRNEIKNVTGIVNVDVNQLGKKISELGNQSQELQNKLDSSLCALKSQINLLIDNLVAEAIRKIRKINEEIQELENRTASYKERNEKYQVQKQEFYLRFGRMPELSENAKKQSKLQEKEMKKNTAEIEDFKLQIELIQEEISELARIKKEFKNGNWDYIINAVEEIHIEELKIEELGVIEDFYVEEFKVEEFEKEQEPRVVVEETIIEEPDEEIEKIARAIVEEIAEEQQKQNNIAKSEDIITFEEKEEKKERVIIPLFGQKASISNITIKLEDGELVYKTQMSDDEEIKIYPSKISEQNVLLRDKQNREECKEILVNYANSEFKVFDKKVLSQIDPLVCELLIECAEKYDYNAQELIYNYAMTFSNNEDVDLVAPITYNMCYLEESKLSKKEKSIIKKICKNARKNSRIEIIESFSGFRKIKYILKKIFTVNNIKVLPDAKY